MEKFNLTNYRSWLITNYFKEETPQDILECLSQGSLVPFKYLKLLDSHAAKRYIDRYVHTAINKKNTRISLNKYLLNLYGYKICNNCEQTLSLQDFHTLASVWDEKQAICKFCRKNEDNIRYSVNHEEMSLVGKKYYEANRELLISKTRKWQEENRDKVNAVAAKRRAIKKLACPKWLTKSQQEEILNFYTQAKLLSEQTGIAYQVDHIVPLKGKNVCGLHVPWNLQVITATENISKGNRTNGI
jgi:hypothetical protein